MITTIKSSVTLDFVNIPIHGDNILVSVNNGNSSTNHNESAREQRQGANQYELVLPPPTSVQAVFAFVSAWNLDHKDVGGYDNMKARTFVDNNDGRTKAIIEIENREWTFISVSGISIVKNDVTWSKVDGEVASDGAFTTQFLNADCTWANYTINITGGTPPFTINGAPEGTKIANTNSDTFRLNRGAAKTISVQDSNGTFIGADPVVPPKAIKASNFTVDLLPENGGYTASTYPNLNFETNLQPFEYSLDGVAYNQTGSFPNLGFDTTFNLRIRDVFGCIISKTFVTGEDYNTDLSQQQLRNFYHSNAGSLIIKECTEFTHIVKKNPLNTLSCQEAVGIPYTYAHEFDSKDFIVEQFKSSYGYHKITLIENGVAKYIEPNLQSQNLNQKEKVDAKMFSTVTGNLGIYFANGARYTPDTADVHPTEPVSEYDSDTLPSWAEAGQNVFIEGVGIKQIKRIITDPLRGKALQMNDVYTGVENDIIVQANYNRQDYNTYEFGFSMSSIISSARIIIEVGFNNLVERTFASELISNVSDDVSKSLCTWNDDENLSGIVHQTGIEHAARLNCQLTHKTVRGAELSNGDDSVRSLDQSAYIAADLKLYVKGFGMENKLALASGMGNFKINNVNYKVETWDSEIQGDSNIYEITALLRMTGNTISFDDQELVLDPPSTPITAKPGAPENIPNLLAFNVDSLILNGEGGFIVVDV